MTTATTSIDITTMRGGLSSIEDLKIMMMRSAMGKKSRRRRRRTRAKSKKSSLWIKRMCRRLTLMRLLIKRKESQSKLLILKRVRYNLNTQESITTTTISE